MKRASKLLIEKLESEVGPLTFGMFLRVSRNSMGLTQQEMANQLGMAIEACFADQLKKAKSKLHVTVTPRLKINEAS
jgi:transcriptional regulator with XRE-family HTH domain